MPIRLRKKLWIIPPFLYLNASNSGLSWSLKIGPWSRNSRTGRNRVDLPGPISWVGRTRGQRAVIRERRRGRRDQRQADRAARNAERAKEREQKAERRRQERQKWDTYWRERSAPRPEQKDAPIVGTVINRTDGTSTEQAPTVPGQRCRHCGARVKNGICQALCDKGMEEHNAEAHRQIARNTYQRRREQEDRQAARAAEQQARQAAQRAGLCGQRTQDGTPCQRRGRCAAGTHSRRR